MKKKRVLLTNDDGIQAAGLWALSQSFSNRYDVTVVAPDRERSAAGHGITIHNPLRATRVCVNGAGWGYAVNGTPADCVKLGILEIMSAAPDIVVSGINPGSNVGVDINYSGTVAAAKEAALFGVLAISASIGERDVNNYEDAARFVEHLVGNITCKGLPVGTFLNVNFPSGDLAHVSGIRIDRQGIDYTITDSETNAYFEKRLDPRNRPYYWHGAESRCTDLSPGTDCEGLSNNYISITPIKCDMTDYDLFADLKTWLVADKGKLADQLNAAKSSGPNQYLQDG